MNHKRDIITAAVVNFKPTTGDKQANLSRLVDFSIAAAKRGADLVLFPEMCLMGYDYFTNPQISDKDKNDATETVRGPSCSVLTRISREYGIYIVFGMSEKLEEDSDTLYNSAVVLGPEGLVGAYQKIHPFAEENTWCAKGENPFLFETPWGPIAVGICFDSYEFPELIRYYAYKGARLYLNPTAVIEPIPHAGSREAFIGAYTPHLEYGVMVNSIYIASSNLTGYDDTSYFAGGSMILGPKTNAFHDVSATRYCGDDNDFQVGLHLATLDLSLATRRLFKDNAITGTPDFRPDVYKKFY